MDLLTRLLHPPDLRATYEPTADFWYQPVPGAITSAGVRVDAESAQRVSAFYRGLNILSVDLAKPPLELYERLSDGGKKRARNNPLYDLLHTQPNAWQSSFEWRRQGIRNLILRGNWYNRIVAGKRGPVDQLIPIPPDLVTPQQLPNGRILYHIRDPKTGTTSTEVQDDIFHVRGVSDDGVVGKSVLTWARESIGIALATESYASRLFSQGSLHSGIISTPGLLDPEASKRMAQSFATAADKWHLPKVLEEGATYTETKLTPEDSQFLLSRQFSVTEMARWLGLPPHKIADLSRSTNNNIEHQALEYHDDLSGWAVNIEQAILRDLILNPARFFAEFNLDVILRADAAARGELYSKLFNIGAVSQNDVRTRENWNKIPNGDTYFVPANMRPTDAPYDAATAAQASGPPVPAGAPPKALDVNVPGLEAIAVGSASTLLKKEINTVRRLAVKHAADADAFAVSVTDFYAGHVDLVMAWLHTSRAVAEAYCAGQSAQILTGDWLVAVTLWKTEDYAAGLLGLALEPS